jgi:polyhydroxyalkanoate synthase subunit PhaC
MIQTAQDADNAAAPLDALLVDAAFGPLRTFAPDMSTARVAGRLVRHPRRTGRRLTALAIELGRVGAGSSAVRPEGSDRRFTDPAWTANPLLRRLVQAYLAAGHTFDELIADSDLDWRDEQRVRFLAGNMVEALAPSNVPLINPASTKTGIDTAGMSFVRGARNFVRDMASAPRIPQMVDGSGFAVGVNLAVTPGHGRPADRGVRADRLQPADADGPYGAAAAGAADHQQVLRGRPRPGPQLDAAPRAGRPAGVRDVVAQSRCPARRVGPGHLHRAVLDALDAVEGICGTDRTVLTGMCSGGIIASLVAAHLAATDRQNRLMLDR